MTVIVTMSSGQVLHLSTYWGFGEPVTVEQLIKPPEPDDGFPYFTLENGTELRVNRSQICTIEEVGGFASSSEHWYLEAVRQAASRKAEHATGELRTKLLDIQVDVLEIERILREGATE